MARITFFTFVPCQSMDDLPEPQRPFVAHFRAREALIADAERRGQDWDEADVRPGAVLEVTIRGDIEALVHNPHEGCWIYGATAEQEAAIRALGDAPLLKGSGRRLAGFR